MNQLEQRKTVIRIRHLQAFGIEFWPEQWEGSACYGALDPATGEITVTPTDDWIQPRPEWWRWLGYYLLAVPLDWFIWHVRDKFEPDEEADEDDDVGFPSDPEWEDSSISVKDTGPITITGWWGDKEK